MSLENASDYFEQIVEPDWKEFSKKPLDIRLAIHAAFSHYHMADWYWHDNFSEASRVFSKEKSKDFVLQLKNSFGNFSLLGDVANSYKHFSIQHYDPDTVREDPIQETELPYPEAIIYGANFAAGEPGSALFLRPENGQLQMIRKFMLKWVLGRTINLWAVLVRHPEIGIEDVIAQIGDY